MFPFGIGLADQLRGPVAVHYQPGSAGVLQTYCNAVGRHVGVERQPGGACLGNGQLHHQQIQSPRQPQAHDLAGTHAMLDQVVRGQIGGRVEFGIGKCLAGGPVNQRGLVCKSRRRGLEHIGQHLVAQQIGPVGPTHNQVLNFRNRPGGMRPDAFGIFG